jgi:hypothetical protein
MVTFNAISLSSYSLCHADCGSIGHFAPHLPHRTAFARSVGRKIARAPEQADRRNATIRTPLAPTDSPPCKKVSHHETL